MVFEVQVRLVLMLLLQLIILVYLYLLMLLQPVNIFFKLLQYIVLKLSIADPDIHLHLQYQ